MAFGMMLWLCAACLRVCVEDVHFSLLEYIYVCCLFQTEQWEVGWLLVRDCQEISQNPFRKETCLHAVLKGDAHDIIHTRPLSLWPCCVCCMQFLFLLSLIGTCPWVFAHICVCLCFVSFLTLTFFPHLLWVSAKTLKPSGSLPPHTAPACTSSFRSDYLGSHWQSIVCCTDMPFVYRGF